MLHQVLAISTVSLKVKGLLYSCLLIERLPSGSTMLDIWKPSIELSGFPQVVRYVVKEVISSSTVPWALVVLQEGSVHNRFLQWLLLLAECAVMDYYGQ